jgi:hypothetical protein
MEDKKFSELIRTVRALKSVNPTDIDIAQAVRAFTMDDRLSDEQKILLQNELKRKVPDIRTYYDATDYF